MGSPDGAGEGSAAAPGGREVEQGSGVSPENQPQDGRNPPGAHYEQAGCTLCRRLGPLCHSESSDGRISCKLSLRPPLPPSVLPCIAPHRGSAIFIAVASTCRPFVGR